MKTVYSAIQPSGELTIGNYLGAIKNWLQFQDEYKCFFSVADFHAITVKQDPALLRERSRKLIAVYLAAGLDPKKVTLYINSHVSEHAELAWVLHTVVNLGQLYRMTQFKTKVQSGDELNANAGLFCYPILMAADILLYDTELVPVGDDQKQHVEITRDIAERFNYQFGETFVLPEALIQKSGARIKSLQDPLKKMSKSDENPGAYLLLLEDKKSLEKKIKRAVTDSEGIVRYIDEQPGIKNLLDIYHVFSGDPIDEIVARYEGKGYGHLKKDLIEVVDGVLSPLRVETERYLSDTTYLDEVIKEGTLKAREVASNTLQRVYDRIG
ncbi:MAG: tryptophan--tRNA ligase, partial [Tissierellia bacterium]|nr:tryptophan--tRNA ligase [Tissierellia bacterium]